MAHQLLEAGLTTMEFARGNTFSFIEEVPEDKWCHQPIPDCNHTAWIVGHLAATDDYFLSTLSGRPSCLPERFKELFAMGSKPVGDSSAYPSPSELKAKLSGCREDLVAWLKSLDETKLLSPLPGDLANFAPSHAALCPVLAWHEGLHGGQLTMIRKALGIAPKFG